MKKIIPFVVLFILSSCSNLSSNKIFDDYEFEESEMAVLAIFWGGGEDDNGITKNFGEFYIDDISVLNELKSNWIFDKQGFSHACGYHYNIEVVENKKSKETLLINFNCNDISTKDGHYYFDEEYFDILKNKVKPLFSETKKFSNIDKARDYVIKIQNDKDLLLIYEKEPEWLTFEGNFSFIYIDSSEPAHEDVLSKVREFLQSKYSNYKFKLDIGGYATGGEYFIKVICNKTLYDSFDFDKFEPWGKWVQENLTLTSYWKRKKIKTLPNNI